MRFEELRVGQTFMYNEGIYIKCFCPNKLGTVNALCMLRSTDHYAGYVANVSDTANVSKADIKIVVNIGGYEEASDE